MRREPFLPTTADARGRLPIGEPHSSFFQIPMDDDVRLLVPVPAPFEGKPVTLEDIRRAAKRALAQLDDQLLLGTSAGGKLIFHKLSSRYLITGRYHQVVTDLIAKSYPGPVYDDPAQLDESSQDSDLVPLLLAGATNPSDTTEISNTFVDGVYQIVHGEKAHDLLLAEAITGGYTRIDAKRRDGLTLTSSEYPDGIFVRRDLNQLAKELTAD